jgi:histidinol-phosphate aminotransferase
MMFDINKIGRKCIVEAGKYIPGKPIEEVEREYGITNITKLASNENPFGASPKALEAMIKELRDNVQLYPESSCFMLREKLAEKFALPLDYFFVDNGLDGVITVLGLTFINPGEEVITADLSFPAYKNITQKMDGILITVPVNGGYGFDIEGILGAVNDKTKMIFLSNPNNPTGTIIEAGSFEKLIEGVPDDVLIVSDEAYYEFVDDSSYPDTLSLLGAHKNLVILRTFSKIMGIAGVRVGYSIAHPEIIEIMMKARMPFPTNRIGQAGALASMDDDDFVKKVSIHTIEERKFLSGELANLGFQPVESHTNFVFAELIKPNENLYVDLLKRGIIIRPVAYKEKQFFRISIGTREENRRLLQTLRELL